MKKILNNPVLSLLARIIVGSVFIYAAIGKIADPAFFAKEIANYRMLPEFTLNIIALSMPWMELVVAVFLIAGIRLKANAVISGLLLAVFIFAVLSAMARGLNISCGCFSHKIVFVGWKKILENTGLLIACVYIFVYPVATLTVEHLARNE